MVQWIGLVVAVVAAYFAWRANHKSDDANEIARRALAISEEEHEQRRFDRVARARLAIDARIVGREPDAAGVIGLSGTSAWLRLEIIVRNAGERDAGRGQIAVMLPLTVNDSFTRWSDASGQDLPEFPRYASRIGERNVLDRTLEGVSRDVPEKLYVRFPVDVPDGDGINAYPISVAVTAEGADTAEIEFPLRIGRDPSL